MAQLMESLGRPQPVADVAVGASQVPHRRTANPPSIGPTGLISPQESGSLNGCRPVGFRHLSGDTEALSLGPTPEPRRWTTDMLGASTVPRKSTQGAELEHLRGQVAGLSSRLGALEGILPTSEQKDAGRSPLQMSTGSTPQVLDHPLQPTRDPLVPAGRPLAPSSSSALPLMEPTHAPTKSAAAPSALLSLPVHGSYPVLKHQPEHRSGGVETALLKARKTFAEKRNRAAPPPPAPQATIETMAQVADSVAGMEKEIQQPPNLSSWGHLSPSVEQRSPRLSGDEHAQALHAAWLVARAAAATPKMSLVTPHSPQASPQPGPGPAGAKPASAERPAEVKQREQEQRELPVEASSDKAVEREGKACSPEGMDFQQVMHIHVKCGDTHVKLGDLLPLMVGAGLGGDLAGAFKMAAAQDGAFKPRRRLSSSKPVAEQPARLLGPQDARASLDTEGRRSGRERAQDARAVSEANAVGSRAEELQPGSPNNAAARRGLPQLPRSSSLEELCRAVDANVSGSFHSSVHHLQESSKAAGSPLQIHASHPRARRASTAPPEVTRTAGRNRHLTSLPSNTASWLEEAKQSMSFMAAAVSAFSPSLSEGQAPQRGLSPGRRNPASRGAGSRQPSPVATRRVSQDGGGSRQPSPASRGTSPNSRRSSSAGRRRERRPRKRQSRERNGSEDERDEAPHSFWPQQAGGSAGRSPQGEAPPQRQSLEALPAAPDFPLPDPPSAMCTRPSSPDAQRPWRQETAGTSPPPERRLNPLSVATSSPVPEGEAVVKAGSPEPEGESEALNSSLAQAIDFDEIEKEAEKAEIAALKVAPSSLLFTCRTPFLAAL